MFFRYELRTTDPDAARAFYAEAVGVDVSAEGLGISLLPEKARARGAPSHWLGHLRVADVAASTRRLLELGAETLGPPGRVPPILRDPGGAVIALGTSAEAPRRAPVAWHHLHTRDLDESWAVYAELFGWTHTETLDVPDPVGGFRAFAWDASNESVGTVANTARWPGVHTHWQFYFPVADLDTAVAQVLARGGKLATSPGVLPSGERMAPCDDPQGAAFGLLQRRARP